MGIILKTNSYTTGFMAFKLSSLLLAVCMVTLLKICHIAKLTSNQPVFVNKTLERAETKTRSGDMS